MRATLANGRVSLSVVLVALLAAAFVPLALLVVQLDHEEREQTTEAAEERALAVVDAIVARHEERISAARAVLDGLAAGARLQGSGVARCSRTLSAVTRRNALVASLAVIGKAGRIICGRTGVRIASLRTAPFFHRVREAGSATAGGLVGGRSEPQLTLAHGVPWNGEADRAVLVATLGLSWVRDSAETGRLPDGSHVAIVDAGRMLAQFSSQDGRLRPDDGPALALDQIGDRTGGTFTARTDGGTVHRHAFRQTTAAVTGALTFVASVPIAAFGAEADRIRRRNLLALAATFAIAALGYVLIAGLLVVRPIRRLGDAAEVLARGGFTPPPGPRPRIRELARLAASFDDSARTLAGRERERNAATTDAERLAEQRRLLVEEVLHGEERERGRLSEALHDDTLQILLAARQELAEAARGDATALARGRERVEEAKRTLRELVTELSPATIRFGSLAENVSDAVSRQMRESGMSVTLDLDEVPGTRHDHLLVRAAGELSGNAVRHARAQRVWVSLEQRDGEITLVVEDDGTGFTPDLPASLREGHVGLASLAARAEASGGSLLVTRSVHGGARVVLRVPAAGGRLRA